MIADENMASAAVLAKVCESISGIDLVAVVRSSDMLMARIRRNAVDLMFLDMSGDMGGPGTIDAIRRTCPGMDILLLYRPDSRQEKVLVEALEKGVYECVDKTRLDHDRTRKELRLHLMALAGLLQSRKRFARPKDAAYRSKFFMPPAGKEVEDRAESRDENRTKPRSEGPAREQVPKAGPFRADVVVIASSTGGPEILSRIFSLLPGDLGVPILLVQHIPKGMSRYFAQSLDKCSELRVCEAADGQEITPSTVYVAPAGLHMTVSMPDDGNRRYVRLGQGPAVQGVKPSADVLFASVARSYDRHILAVVLTGMGEDGKEGVRALKEKDCVCLTQAAETCVVNGMPKAVVEAGLSDGQLAPIGLTHRISLWSRR